MNILPNVSILMPTYNRNKFIELILHNILSQTYPKNKLEWIIIDDGEEKLINDENKIRNIIFPIKLKYIRINPKNKLKIGEKRNYLVKYCSYDYCINMDDDDIYLNNYILKSILFLLAKKTDLVGSNQMIFYFPKHQAFTKISCRSKRQIHEATMCFKKNHWMKTKGFKNSNSSEGSKMIDRYEENVYNINIDGLMYCLCHENNSYPKDSFLHKKPVNLRLDYNRYKIIKKIFDNNNEINRSTW